MTACWRDLCPTRWMIRTSVFLISFCNVLSQKVIKKTPDHEGLDRLLTIWRFQSIKDFFGCSPHRSRGRRFMLGLEGNCQGFDRPKIKIYPLKSFGSDFGFIKALFLSKPYRNGWKEARSAFRCIKRPEGKSDKGYAGFSPALFAGPPQGVRWETGLAACGQNRPKEKNKDIRQTWI